jgi:hypothetical protein
MKRELHVRFCERLEGETPSCLLSDRRDPAFKKLLANREHTQNLEAMQAYQNDVNTKKRPPDTDGLSI